MKDSEFKALLTLLADTDDFISGKAREKLISDFDEIENKIYDFLSKTENHYLASALNSIIQEFYFNSVSKQLLEWYEHSDDDLLQGIYLVSKIFDNKIEFSKLQNYFNNIRRKMFFDIENLSLIEKLKLINILLFREEKFKISSNLNNISNFLIAKVIQQKTASNILIAAIYKILAGKLGIPVIILRRQGILLLAATDSFETIKKNNLAKHFLYVNPFDRLSVFSFDEIRHSLNLKSNSTFKDFKITENSDILRLLIGKFIKFAKFQKDQNTMNLLVELHKILH